MNARSPESPAPAPAPVRIDTTRCTGCGRCVAACPPAVLCLQPLGWVKTAALHASGCTGCARCVAVCPFDAVHTLRRGPK